MTGSDDDMLPESDVGGAVRGKYYERYLQGTNVVLLDPDVASAFKDSAPVNDALRLLISPGRSQGAAIAVPSIVKTCEPRPGQKVNRAISVPVRPVR